MRPFRLTIFILVGVLYASAFGKDWIARSIELTINGRFDQARALIEPFKLQTDSALQAYFYDASVLNSRMSYLENDRDGRAFIEDLDSVLALSQRSVAKHRIDQARLYFYRGSALGYKAFYQGKHGQWLDALRNGMRSVSDLHKAVELDSSLWDAYLGIGVYQYWKSTKLKFLLWTPFVSDTRDKGIENILKAVNHPCYSQYMAMHQLVYILLNYGDFDQAWYYAQKVRAAFPDSPFMRWAYAHSLYKMHRNRQAIRAYSQILDSLSMDNPNWLICHLRLAELFSRLKDKKECKKHLTVIFGANKDSYPQGISRRVWDKAGELEKNCAQY